MMPSVVKQVIRLYIVYLVDSVIVKAKDEGRYARDVVLGATTIARYYCDYVHSDVPLGLIIILE